MSRKKLLTPASPEDQVKSTIETVIKKDDKFLKRKKQELSDQMEDLDDKIKERLASDSPIDESVVMVSFFQYCKLEAELKLYTDFEKKYLQD
jgi:Skp family chaperone for outer membrane proteins